MLCRILSIRLSILWIQLSMLCRILSIRLSILRILLSMLSRMVVGGGDHNDSNDKVVVLQHDGLVLTGCLLPIESTTTEWS